MVGGETCLRAVCVLAPLLILRLHSLPSPVVAHTVGTVLYATCVSRCEALISLMLRIKVHSEPFLSLRFLRGRFYNL